MLPPLYAYRLGRAYGPDSSAVGLRGALAAGVDGLESDVCLTADGALVLVHGPYLPLGTNLVGFAHQRTAREIRRARLRDREGRLTAEAPLSWRTCSRPRRASSSSSSRSRPTQTRPVHAHGERACGAPARPDAWAARRVLSFTATACARAAALNYSARLVVWADYAPAALVRWARRHGVGGVCVEHFLLSSALVGALRRGGLSVTTGTLDEPGLLERLLPLRPDAVTSDRPHALREAAASVPSLAA